MKALLIIDNSKIRSEALAEAQQWMQQWDLLEKDLRTFHDHDQPLFSSWFDLSFHAQQERLSHLQTEMRELARFHNWLVASSKMYHISMTQALHLLRTEEQQYQNGSPEVKVRIEEKRRQRDDFIQNEMQKGPEEEKGSHVQPSSPRDEEEEIIFTEITRMNNRKIQLICKNRTDAFRLLGLSLSLARSEEDKAVFLKVWDLVPRQHQDSFSMHFTKETGTSLRKAIAEMREEIDNTQPRPQVLPTTEPTSNTTIEELKLLYRKVVRRLHPDLQPMTSLWQKKMWVRVQAAHKEQDSRELQKILRLSLIRSGDLQELSLSEILESQSWWKEEWLAIRNEIQELKKQPAWNFSQNKDHSSLHKKIDLSLKADVRHLSQQIYELRAEHQILELKAQDEKQDRSRIFDFEVNL